MGALTTAFIETCVRAARAGNAQHLRSSPPAAIRTSPSYHLSFRAGSLEYIITVTDVADEDSRKAIVAPLVEYNDRKAGPSGYRPLTVLLEDGGSSIIGGMWGATGYGWLFIQFLAVPEALRGRGVGTELMQRAEREAVARGCHSAWLDTFEFQARGFYERIGYRCFGELPNYPVGFSRFFMKKVIAPVK